MKKILILMGRYMPGYKDGGPVRTIINVTDMLGDEYEFYIACLDRDHGDNAPYPGIKKNSWNQIGKAKVWYVSPKGFTEELILKLAEGKSLIYLCSFYDDYGYKTLMLNKRKRLPCPVVLASMGVFSAGALAQKSMKKQIFIHTLKLAGLFENITWSVTSEVEKREVQKNVGAQARCVIAEDLPRNSVPGKSEEIMEKDFLKVVFLSRISPKKNLYGAIKCLGNCRSRIDFTIYGPREDEDYWKKCREKLHRLPDNITWKYKGDVPPEQVQEEFGSQDVFLFPTLGENYGHVIFEALSAGCIPVISDQTPWQVIAEEGAGYVLPLENELDNFSEVIDALAQMPMSERIQMSKHAVAVAEKKVADNRRTTGYRTIFG